jgi:sigma-B regulation protein RsbU (phosphoserine phosphatase)
LQSFDEFLSQIVSIMDHVPTGILISLDPDGQALLANRAVHDLVGAEQRDDRILQRPRFLTPTIGHVVAWDRLPLQRAMDQKASIAAADYEVVRADGVRKFVTMSAAPLRDETGNVRGGVAVLVDVSKLRMLEADLRRKRDGLLDEFAQQKRIAETFQNAQLPDTLPRVSGFALNGLYRSADAGARVGGDWYDAFPLSDGRIGLSIGDVMGHGLEAAVTMGKLRQAIQSAAFVSPNPSVMLDAASRTLMLHDRELIASAVAGVLNPGTGKLTFAAAGHPLPMVRRGDATLVEFSGIAAPLGVSGRCDAQEHAVKLLPGDLAVFYTDGLIEATRDADTGEKLLRSALRASTVLESDDPAASLHACVIGPYKSRDDVAILTVTRLVRR